MKFKKIQEGEVKLSVPEGVIYDASVFYNPEGEMTRDISVCAFQELQKEFGEKITMCDALAGSGVKGLRYAKEITGVKKSFINIKNL